MLGDRVEFGTAGADLFEREGVLVREVAGVRHDPSDDAAGPRSHTGRCRCGGEGFEGAQVAPGGLDTSPEAHGLDFLVELCAVTAAVVPPLVEVGCVRVEDARSFVALTSSSSMLVARAKRRTVDRSSRSVWQIPSSELPSARSCCTAAYRSFVRVTRRRSWPQASSVELATGGGVCQIPSPGGGSPVRWSRTPSGRKRDGLLRSSPLLRRGSSINASRRLSVSPAGRRCGRPRHRPRRGPCR